MVKTDAQLWDMIVEFNQLNTQEPTREGMARQLSIAAHMQEWLDLHPGAADTMDDYHLAQSAALCVAMAPHRQDVRALSAIG